MATNRIDELKSRIAALQHEQDALLDELVEAQAADWDAGLEELKMQLHLGAMDLRDRVAPVLDSLRDRIHDLSSEVAHADGATLVDVYDALRRGFTAAVDDLVTAARDAREVLTGHPSTS